MEQAREAAKRLVADDGESKARGGPWCRRALPSEAAAVATCTSRAAVRSLAAKAFRGGSLACHLATIRTGAVEALEKLDCGSLSRCQQGRYNRATMISSSGVATCAGAVV